MSIALTPHPTVLQTVQRPGVCSAVMVLCTIKNPWSHMIRIGHSPDFRIQSVEMLPWLCRKRHKVIFSHSLMAINACLSPFKYSPLLNSSSFYLTFLRCPLTLLRRYLTHFCRFPTFVRHLLIDFCHPLPPLSFNLTLFVTCQRFSVAI